MAQCPVQGLSWLTSSWILTASVLAPHWQEWLKEAWLSPPQQGLSSEIKGLQCMESTRAALCLLYCCWFLISKMILAMLQVPSLWQFSKAPGIHENSVSNSMNTFKQISQCPIFWPFWSNTIFSEVIRTSWGHVWSLTGEGRRGITGLPAAIRVWQLKDIHKPAGVIQCHP